MKMFENGLKKIGKIINDRYGDKPTIEINPYTSLSNDDLLTLVKEVYTLGMCDSISIEPKSEMLAMLLDKENKSDGLYMNYSHVRTLIEGEFLHRVRNGVNFTKGKTEYILVFSTLEHNGNIVSNSFHPESFNTLEELKATWENECKNRCKNDGYDERWNNIPLMYEKITTETFFNN